MRCSTPTPRHGDGEQVGVRSAAAHLVWAEMHNNMLYHLGAGDPRDEEGPRR